jgi:hypothetical protein
MIIGLNGLKNCGKDTVAAYLIKEHGFERRALADPLKRSVAALFDIPFNKVDELKNDPDAVVALHDEDGADPWRKMTFREFLQRFGKEASMDVWGEDCWNDLTLEQRTYPGRNIVVTDVRFEANAKRVLDCGGYVIEVIRPEVDEKDPHSGEQPLPRHLVSLVLDNSGTIEDLYRNMENALSYLGEKSYTKAANG